jgi:hypothetical protein
MGEFMTRNENEKEMMEAFRQLSDSGRIDALSYTKTVLRAENGVKRSLGLDKTQKRPPKGRESA